MEAGVYTGKSNQITKVTDTGGNTWVRGQAFFQGGHYSDGELWYAANAKPATTVTVTLRLPATVAMQIEEFSGAATSNPVVDTLNGASDKSALADSGMVTPTIAGDLAIGWAAGHGSTQTLTPTATGYENMAQQTSSDAGATPVSLISGYQLLSSTSSQHFGASFGKAMYWASGVTYFRAAGPPPAPAPSPSPSTSPTPSTSPSPSPSPGPSPSPSPSPSPGGACNLVPPIRAAFYYPWYPENWTESGIYPATRYNPGYGFYSLDASSGGLDIERSQIAAMQYGRIQAGIASWWGPGSRTDIRIADLLSAANGTGFCWTLYYEPAVTGGSAQIASDLAYIQSHYASNPNFLHVNGKPVLFVYSRAVASCTDAATWNASNNGQYYLNLQVFGGYTGCASQPDNWHQYGPAVAVDHQSGHSYTISPGFYKYSEASPRLVRDPARWQLNVNAMVASREPWQLITTFNEWLEGTSVENAVEWQSASGQGTYLDALHG